MSTYKTFAIILKIKDLGEYDQLITLYTQDLGKLVVKAKSTKKTTAKLANQLALFNLVNVRLAQGKTFDTIASIYILNDFLEIKKSLAKTATAFCFVNLLDQFIAGQQKDIRLWRLINNSLNYLENLPQNSTDHLQLALAIFQIRLLQILGQHPDLDHCCICQTPLVENKNFCPPLSLNHGGLICLQCRKATPETPITHKIIRSQTIDLWQELTDPRNKQITFKIRPNQIQELNKILNDFLSYQSSQRLQSLAFYRKIVS